MSFSRKLPNRNVQCDYYHLLADCQTCNGRILTMFNPNEPIPKCDCTKGITDPGIIQSAHKRLIITKGDTDFDEYGYDSKQYPKVSQRLLKQDRSSRRVLGKKIRGGRHCLNRLNALNPLAKIMFANPDADSPPKPVPAPKKLHGPQENLPDTKLKFVKVQKNKAKPQVLKEEKEKKEKKEKKERKEKKEKKEKSAKQNDQIKKDYYAHKIEDLERQTQEVCKKYEQIKKSDKKGVQKCIDKPPKKHSSDLQKLARCRPTTEVNKVEEFMVDTSYSLPKVSAVQNFMEDKPLPEEFGENSEAEISVPKFSLPYELPFLSFEPPTPSVQHYNMDIPYSYYKESATSAVVADVSYPDSDESDAEYSLDDIMNPTPRVSRYRDFMEDVPFPMPRRFADRYDPMLPPIPPMVGTRHPISKRNEAVKFVVEEPDPPPRVSRVKYFKKNITPVKPKGFVEIGKGKSLFSTIPPSNKGFTELDKKVLSLSSPKLPAQPRKVDISFPNPKLSAQHSKVDIPHLNPKRNDAEKFVVDEPNPRPKVSGVQDFKENVPLLMPEGFAENGKRDFPFPTSKGFGELGKKKLSFSPDPPPKLSGVQDFMEDEQFPMPYGFAEHAKEEILSPIPKSTFLFQNQSDDEDFEELFSSASSEGSIKKYPKSKIYVRDRKKFRPPKFLDNNMKKYLSSHPNRSTEAEWIKFLNLSKKPGAKKGFNIIKEFLLKFPVSSFYRKVLKSGLRQKKHYCQMKPPPKPQPKPQLPFFHRTISEIIMGEYTCNHAVCKKMVDAHFPSFLKTAEPFIAPVKYPPSTKSCTYKYFVSEGSKIFQHQNSTPAYVKNIMSDQEKYRIRVVKARFDRLENDYLTANNAVCVPNHEEDLDDDCIVSLNFCESTINKINDVVDQAEWTWDFDYE